MSEAFSGLPSGPAFTTLRRRKEDDLRIQSKVEGEGVGELGSDDKLELSCGLCLPMKLKAKEGGIA